MNRHIPFIDELWGDSKVDLETGVASIVPESRSESTSGIYQNRYTQRTKATDCTEWSNRGDTNGIAEAHTIPIGEYAQKVSVVAGEACVPEPEDTIGEPKRKKKRKRSAGANSKTAGVVDAAVEDNIIEPCGGNEDDTCPAPSLPTKDIPKARNKKRTPNTALLVSSDAEKLVPSSSEANKGMVE